MIAARIISGSYHHQTIDVAAILSINRVSDADTMVCRLNDLKVFPLNFHARFAYDDKRLAESIAGRSSLLRSPSDPQAPVELILGIYSIIINIVQVFR